MGHRFILAFLILEVLILLSILLTVIFLAYPGLIILIVIILIFLNTNLPRPNFIFRRLNLTVNGCQIGWLLFIVERTRAFAFVPAGWGGGAGAAGAGISWGAGG